MCFVPRTGQKYGINCLHVWKRNLHSVTSLDVKIKTIVLMIRFSALTCRTRALRKYRHLFSFLFSLAMSGNGDPRTCKMMKNLKVGIIGGTGLDNSKFFTDRYEKTVMTPYGDPSATFVCGKIEGVDCILLSRHGSGHSISPTNVNYRANICALHQEGCTHILVTTACGSLKDEIEPGHFIVLDQLIDRTLKRDVTFYDQKKGSWPGVCHIPMSFPFSDHMRKVLIEACKINAANFHPSGTTVTIEGPRFSTYAESMLFKSWGADLVNMTSVPEATLAKEIGIMYGSLAMATDYDCWKQTTETVTVEAVLAIFRKNAELAVTILRTAVKLIGEKDWTQEIEDAKRTAERAMM